MLSTRLGYFRRARFAAAFASVFFFGVSLVCRTLFGADLSQGLIDFLAMLPFRLPDAFRPCGGY